MCTDRRARRSRSRASTLDVVIVIGLQLLAGTGA
jgi:hypothetical protein